VLVLGISIDYGGMSMNDSLCLFELGCGTVLTSTKLIRDLTLSLSKKFISNGMLYALLKYADRVLVNQARLKFRTGYLYEVAPGLRT